MIMNNDKNYLPAAGSGFFKGIIQFFRCMLKDRPDNATAAYGGGVKSGYSLNILEKRSKYDFIIK
jgi:hypothetical protein